ncbi:lipid A biosynthesis protein [Thermaurantimonas aggregans]|uniref:Lipid A biosynthesis protein n=1 Tax=Thermaurantimonas aggregans TaxID=2173829 RepID=A0A401XJ12_9FLAO|nr:lysophospholipid acyltransferase family protein [Thermaurantimonas aggregans]MCX8149001.1 lysophospholipid acyltransferase family protein [Thermaurantimonas aggregans]GCD76983.1 lipid A biosynthesis protein [Thermaurantimonas aggregans]
MAFLIKLISKLPLNVLYTLGNFFYLLSSVFGYRSKVILKNLEIAFPDFKVEERKKIQRKFYKYFFELLAENLKDFDPKWKEHKKYVFIENIEVIKNITNQNKKVIIMLGHHGNFEWLSVIPELLQESVYAVYNEVKNKSIEQLILQKRAKYNLGLFPMKDTYKFIESNTDQRAVYGFIADQSPHEGRINHRSKFFVENTPTHVGAEKIAKMYNMALVYLECVQLRRGKYVFKPVLITEHPRNYPDYQLTDLYNQLLEQNIRNQPEIYLWTHKRWKHLRPGVYQ